MMKRLKAGRRTSAAAQILSSAVKELGAYVVCAHLYPLGFFDLDPRPKKHSKKSHNPRPILFVHGILHNSSAFLFLRRKIRHLDWENLYNFNYKTLSGNVLCMVDDMGKKVDRILQETGSSQIDIIAHSLGGIVARTYMTLGDGRGKVRKLITLGTAHQGTHLSFFAKGWSRGALDKDLKANSFLIRLLSQTTLPPQSELVSIYSPFDWTVLPGDNGAAVGLPKKAVKNVKLDYIGHAGLLYSDEAFDAVVRTITGKED